MHRAHRIALTLMCASLLSILIGLAHVLCLIFHGLRYWPAIAAMFTFEYAIIFALFWRY